jgi:glycosyltransferase involved in cell wall biosynthesis
MKTVADADLERIKVSVVVPFWNRIEDTVHALASIQQQTHTNLEVFFVDDGSTDDLTPLLELCAKDSRARVVHQAHLGAAVARNYGVSLSTGKYVAFLDSDDLFDPPKIETQLRFMESTGSHFCHHSYRRKFIEDDRPDEIISSGTFRGQVFPAIMTHCPIAAPTVMIRRELMLENPFPAGYILSEDSCAWMQLAAKTRLDGIDEVLATIRAGATTTWQSVGTKMKVVRGIIRFAEGHPILSRQRVQIAQLRVELAAYQMESLIESLEKEPGLFDQGLQLGSIDMRLAEWEALLERADPRRRIPRFARSLLGFYRRNVPSALHRRIRPLKPFIWRFRPRPERSAE